MEDTPGLVVLDHPLVQHKLSILRDVSTGPKGFREVVDELGSFLCYAATKDLPLAESTITTPLAETTGMLVAGKKIAVVAVLRAGLGMVQGVLRLLPAARIGHIGLYRDPETLKPITYYSKLPRDIDDRDVLLLDPMLATGGSAAAAIEYLRSVGVTNLKLLCIVAAPDGIEAVRAVDPEVVIYTCAVDSHVDSHGYIVPGLGDAGDRLFGTQ